MNSKIYVLARGKEYVSFPGEVTRKQQMLIFEFPALWSGSQLLWHPNLYLSKEIRNAWSTCSLEVALSRQRILASISGGWATTIKTIP